MAILKHTASDKHPAGTGRGFPEAVRLGLIAAAYFIATRAGLLFVVQPQGLASVWPASGVAIAALMLTERRKWLSVLLIIFATNIAGNFLSGNSLPVSLGFALANCAEAALGAWVIFHACGPRITFERLTEVVALFGVAVVSNGFTALTGALVPALAFGAPYLDTWLTWWVADGLGILLLTPTIVAWATRPIRLLPLKKMAEAGIILIAISALSILIFNPAVSNPFKVVDVYLIFPLLIWAALRFNIRCTTTILLFFSTIAVWLTVLGYSASGLVNHQLQKNLLSVQLLIGIATFSALILVSALAERRRSERALGESEKRYREIVEGTEDLINWVDKNGTILFVNYMAAKIYGIPAQECLGESAFKFIHPDDREKTKHWFFESLAKRVKVATLENRQVNSSTSETFHMLWTSIFHFDENGNATGILGIARNITERKLLEDEKQNLIEQLQTALQEVKTLRGIIPICCYCKQIRDDAGSWSQVEEYIHQHSEAVFSHGICPDCYKKEMDELDKDD